MDCTMLLPTKILQKLLYLWGLQVDTKTEMSGDLTGPL